MFLTSELMLVSKIDLLPYLPFSVDAVAKDARSVNPDLEVMEISTLTDKGMEDWANWILTKLEQKRAANKK